MNICLPPVTDAEVDLRLAEMDRLGARDYTEIGVPMFLVAEDLTGEAAPCAAPDPSGRILAMLLAEGAEAMARRVPDMGAKEIARLIEALADRHFLTLAMPAFSRAADLHPAVLAEASPPEAA